MKNEMIPLPQFVATLDEHIEGGWGNAIATSLVTNYVAGNEVDLKKFFGELIDEEWIVLKLILDIKDQTNQLKHYLSLLDRSKIVRFKVSNVGVHLYGNF